MNDKSVERVEDLCRDLLRRIDAMRGDDWSMKFVTGTKYTSAVRRQSMELTRALAAMRKSL